MRAASDVLFFMHIGKTAGSYLNQCFMKAFGPDQVLEFCQDFIGPTYDTASIANFRGKAVISGHLYLPDWTEFSRIHGLEARLATVLRSPLHQIASAMRYLDGFNDPSRHAATNSMHPLLHEVVLRLAKVDFADAGSIDAFLTTLTPLGVQMFDNQQSRFFLCKERGDTTGFLTRSEPVTLDAVPRLIDAVAQFDLVGLTERLPETLGFMSDLVQRPILPLDTRINESMSPRRIDLEDEWVRRVLGKRTIVDEWLYRYVADRFAPKLHRVGGAGAHETTGEGAAATA
jgi:hypothetical protein